jgi:hypothetical protein
MTVLKRRSKLVTFRVSAEEHEALTKSCVELGARSIADFARDAALRRVQTTGAPPNSLSSDLMTLSKGLRDLDVILGDTRDRIKRILGPGASAPDSGSKESSAAATERSDAANYMSGSFR